MRCILLLACFFILSCKSTISVEKKFKERVAKDFPKVCFRVDESNRVMSFSMNLFDKGEYTYSDKDALGKKFETGIECDYIALSGKIGDSLYTSVVYPYEKKISSSFKEYPNWFYEAKVYLAYIKDKKLIIDTLGIEHNPPLDNPRISEDLDDGI